MPALLIPVSDGEFGHWASRLIWTFEHDLAPLPAGYRSRDERAVGIPEAPGYRVLRGLERPREAELISLRGFRIKEEASTSKPDSMSERHSRAKTVRPRLRSRDRSGDVWFVCGICVKEKKKNPVRLKKQADVRKHLITSHEVEPGAWFEDDAGDKVSARHHTAARAVIEEKRIEVHEKRERDRQVKAGKRGGPTPPPRSKGGRPRRSRSRSPRPSSLRARRSRDRDIQHDASPSGRYSDRPQGHSGSRKGEEGSHRPVEKSSREMQGDARSRSGSRSGGGRGVREDKEPPSGHSKGRDDFIFEDVSDAEGEKVKVSHPPAGARPGTTSVGGESGAGVTQVLPSSAAPAGDRSLISVSPAPPVLSLAVQPVPENVAGPGAALPSGVEGGSTAPPPTGGGGTVDGGTAAGGAVVGNAEGGEGVGRSTLTGGLHDLIASSSLSQFATLMEDSEITAEQLEPSLRAEAEKDNTFLTNDPLQQRVLGSQRGPAQEVCIPPHEDALREGGFPLKVFFARA